MSQARTHAQTREPQTRTGFTLIELLVVIVIIGILAGIALVIGSSVTQGSKSRITEDVIRVLDGTLTEYTAEKGKIPSVFTDDRGREWPLVDARPVSNTDYTSAATPSLAMYFLALREVPGVEQLASGIDSRFVRRGGPDGKAADLKMPGVTGNDPELTKRGATNATKIRDSLWVLDGFGNPIRFVHPKYHGGHGDFFNSTGGAGTPTRPALSVVLGLPSSPTTVQYRRSARPYNPTGTLVKGTVGDGDEGLCVGGRPYFYSAGADGDPGTNADNVYTTRPTFPVESRN